MNAMRRHRTLAATVAAVVVVGLTTSTGPTATPDAHADPLGSAGILAPTPDEVIDPFYLPPVDLPATPGAVIKTEPTTISATLPGTDGTWPANRTRIMFTSRDVHDRPAAVTAMIIEESGPWHGPGDPHP